MRVRAEVVGSGQVAEVDVTVESGGVDRVVSGDMPGGFIVPAGQTWQVDGLVTSDANVVVEGTLRLRPGATLRFVDVDESVFVGGHTAGPVDTDVGLWVTGVGLLDAHGTAKLPWTRVDYPLAAGDTVVVLSVTPYGWQPGDELAVTPTAGDDNYSYTTVRGVDGATVEVDPLTHDHPTFAHPALPQTLGAEVLNLTRDVKIEGTIGGRAHTMFHQTSSPQHLSHVEFRHLGPRKDTGDTYRSGGERVAITAGIKGRYAVHFHMGGEAARGSTMTGMVAHEIGNATFVSHLTIGVTWTECVAHDIWGSGYWWDQRDDGPSGDHPPSDDIAYVRCVGSRRSVDPPFRVRRNSLFDLLEGQGNACVGCVAVGGMGSGFNWTEGSEGVWEFHDCVAHNLGVSGIRGWQNSKNRHTIVRFVVFRCGEAGIDHGAYRNRYLFADGLVAECGRPFLLHANSLSNPDLDIVNLHLDASGRAPFALEGWRHTLPTSTPTSVRRCTLTGYTDHAYGFSYPRDDTDPDLVRLHECRADNDAKVFVADPSRDDVVWVSDGDGADLATLWFPVPEAS